MSSVPKSKDARPWGPKEAFGDLKSPKTPLLTASFLRPFDSGHPIYFRSTSSESEGQFKDSSDTRLSHEMAGMEVGDSHLAVDNTRHISSQIVINGF